MELTQTDAVFSRIAMMLFFVRKIKVLGMTSNFMENIFGIYKKYWRKNQGQGAHTLSTRVGARLPPWARPLSRGPPEAPPTSTPTPYIHVRGEKNQRERFIVFYDTEPPPSPKLSQEG